jgi:hypothetical protein
VQAFWDIYIESLGTARSADVVVLGNTGSVVAVLIPEAFLATSGNANSPATVTVVLDIAASLALPHSLLPYHAVISPSRYAQRAFADLLMSASRGNCSLSSSTVA